MALRTEPNGPWSLQDTTGIDAEADREMLRSAMIQAVGLSYQPLTGIQQIQQVINSGDLLVTASGFPDANIHIAEGQCFIEGTEGAYQGIYHVSNDSTDVPYPTTPGTSAGIRHDIFGIQMQDQAYGVSVSSDPIYAYITGTPGGGDPTSLPTNFIPLARIVWPAINTSIVLAAYIQDLRPLGAWTPYTPNWATQGGAPVLGSGGLNLGRYTVQGKTCHIRMFFLAGSTFNGGTGVWSFGLPFSTNPTSEQLISCVMAGSGFNRINGFGLLPANDNIVEPHFPVCPLALTGYAVNMQYYRYNHAVPASSLLTSGIPQITVGAVPMVAGDWMTLAGAYEIA